MAINWVVVISIAGIALSLFIIPLFFVLPDRNMAANRFLALFLAVLSLILLNNFFLHAGLLQHFPALSATGQFMYFALGPCLYLYIRALSEPAFVFARNDWLHFLPVALSLLAFLPVYGLSAAEKREMASIYFEGYRGGGDNNPRTLLLLPLAMHIHLVQFVLLAVHFATYSALSLRQLRRHGTAIGQVFSTIDRIELTWLKRLCQLVLALCAASLLMLLARIFLADRVSADSRLLPAAIVASLIYFVGLLSLRQPAIYRQSTLATGAEPGPGPDAHEPRKYQSSTLTAAEVDAHWQRLSIYMDAQKPYLTSGLTIGELAGNYGVPQAHLSQVINQSAGMTFFDFINRYRVDYARQLLREARSDLTVLDIGLEAGFNSQSTFYAQFKKWTGVTPSQYRKGASEE